MGGRRPAADAAQALIDFAVSRNVTKIVVGKTAKPRWREVLQGTLADQLIRGSGEARQQFVLRDERSVAVHQQPESVRLAREQAAHASASLNVTGRS